jgi:hypothetical protein
MLWRSDKNSWLFEQLTLLKPTLHLSLCLEVKYVLLLIKLILWCYGRKNTNHVIVWQIPRPFVSKSSITSPASRTTPTRPRTKPAPAISKPVFKRHISKTQSTANAIKVQPTVINNESSQHKVPEQLEAPRLPPTIETHRPQKVSTQFLCWLFVYIFSR